MNMNVVPRTRKPIYRFDARRTP